MFGRMMNNYYYGKSGKGDFRKEDMPETRWQLFWDTLRTRLSALCRLNLLYMLIFLPTMIVLASGYLSLITNLNLVLSAQEGNREAMLEQMGGEENGATLTDEQMQQLASVNAGDMVRSMLFNRLLWLVPCLLITGPFTAGLSYVTRNWARDEHAFIWSDFKDAVKANWKHALGLSAITAVLPMLGYVGWTYYGEMANQQAFMLLPQMLVLMIVIIWSLAITYMHPLQVSYELKFSGLIRNGLLLAVARLPMSVGIRLLHCVPAIIGVLVAFLWNPMYGLLFLFAWYLLIGFSLSRFITASYTNAVFEKYINPQIEGAPVNRGLRDPEDEDEDEEEETADGQDQH